MLLKKDILIELVVDLRDLFLNRKKLIVNIKMFKKRNLFIFDNLILCIKVFKFIFVMIDRFN